jgi:5-methylcytosine-specific restriction endonuclease McrA
MCHKNKEDRAAYRLANKERESAVTKAYFLANKEKQTAYRKAWAKDNPEKMAIKNKKYLLKLNLANNKVSLRTMHAWAVQIKERDCYTCRDCGATENLEAHHIYSKSKHPHRILELDNGTTLCEPCHKYEHSTNGVF